MVNFSQQNTYEVDRDDLTSSLLDLTELLQKVPETRLGNNNVGSKDTHTEKLGSNFLGGREFTTNHLISDISIQNSTSLYPCKIYLIFVELLTANNEKDKRNS